VADPPVRLARDGGVALLVLEDPPLNLFRSETFSSLNECLKQVQISDARAMVWRAEGEVFSGPGLTKDYSVSPLPAGEYYFDCVIHAEMKGAFYVR